MKDYRETLIDLGIEEFKIDIALVDGDIALNKYGDLLLTNQSTDNLYRFISRWRYQEKTIMDLFELWKENNKKFKDIEHARRTWTGIEYRENVEILESYRESASSIAGSIFIILNNLLSILERSNSYNSSIKVNSLEIKKVILAASNNFRHYDEWSKGGMYTKQQLKSVDTLCSLLSIPNNDKHKSIVSNVCSSVLEKISSGDESKIKELISLIAGEYKSKFID